MDGNYVDLEARFIFWLDVLYHSRIARVAHILRAEYHRHYDFVIQPCHPETSVTRRVVCTVDYAWWRFHAALRILTVGGCFGMPRPLHLAFPL